MTKRAHTLTGTRGRIMSAVARREEAFYRSLVFRYACASAALFVAGALTFGPATWHDTPSLRMVRLLMVPWPVYGVLFAAYAVALLTPSIAWQERAFWFGLIAYGYFTLAVLASLRIDRPTNPVILAAAVVGTVSQYASARLAHLAREGL